MPPPMKRVTLDALATDAAKAVSELVLAGDLHSAVHDLIDTTISKLTGTEHDEYTTALVTGRIDQPQQNDAVSSGVTTTKLSRAASRAETSHSTPNEYA